MSKPITVYALIDDDGSVRYIGQTVQSTERRLIQHLSTARVRCAAPVHKWLMSRRNSGREVRIVALATDAVLHETEIALIAQHRASGARLLNMTDGGEGTLGYRHKSRKRPDLVARNKARIGLPGRPRMPGETEKLMAYVRGSKRPWVSERNKLGAGKPGHKHTEEHKRMMSEKTAAYHAAKRAKMAEENNAIHA